MRLQGLREPARPRTQERLRLVLVREPREDPTDQQDSGRLGLQPLVPDGPQEAAAAGQRGIRHQRHQRVVPLHPEQRVQRRHRLARRRLLPREARRLRGLGRAPQLRGVHEPRHPPVNISPLPPRHSLLI